MKAYKPLLISLALSTITIGLSACGSSNNDNSNGNQMVILTFTDELKNMINNYYLKAHPEDVGKIKVEKSELNAMAQTLTQKMDNNGKNLPDMVALEAAVVLNFIEPDYRKYLEPLNDIIESTSTDNMYSYTKDIVTADDGKIYGLAWQATPGGYFYKTDIAEKVGINSYEEMQEQISTWEGFMDLAKKCEEKNIKIVSSITEPAKVFLSSRSSSWVNDNKLTIDPILYEGDYSCMEIMHKLQQNKGYTSRSNERSSVWFNDIKSNDVLGYFASSWSLYYDLKEYAGDTAGNWAMCKGPHSFYNGGTWLSAMSTSSDENKALAKKIIKYFTTDETFLENWGCETGDFMNNKKVMEKIKDDYSCEFLGGQNHLNILYNVAEEINGNLISPYDNKINSSFKTWAGNYAMESTAAKTIEKALSSFKNSVLKNYPTLDIE